MTILCRQFLLINLFQSLAMKIFRLLVAVSFLALGISCPAQSNCVVDEGLQQTFEKSAGEKVGVNIVLKKE